MKTVQTFTATIYVGVKRMSVQSVAGYRVGKVPWLWRFRARKHIQRYCDNVGLCVTFTPTEFIYSYGCEPGFTVGFINYPRFPATPEKIRATALELAQHLRDKFHQFKVSVVFPDETVMIEAE